MSNAQPKSQAVATIEAPRLPYPIAAINYGVDEAMWNTLVTATFPTATTAEGVILALNYCKARRLDIFKRPVHIVPIYTKFKTPDGKEYSKTVESIWPGINEVRITAFRTGSYAGCEPASFGPDLTSEWELPSGSDGDDHPNAPPKEKAANEKASLKKMLRVTHPEWCQITVYRLIEGQKVAFPGPRVYWLETYATSGKSDRPNSMWQDRSRGQLEKCAEAAALRKAFPEELGSDYTIDEAPRMVDVTPVAADVTTRPDRTEIEAKSSREAKPITGTVIEQPTLPATVITPEPEGGISETLDHALNALLKLSSRAEIEGARDALRGELTADEYRTWNTAAMQRERAMNGGRR